MADYMCICEVCGVSFVSTRKDARVHSAGCRSRKAKDLKRGIVPRYRGAREAAMAQVAPLPPVPTVEVSEAVVEAVARELVPHVGPIVREHLTEKVLGAIGHMVDMVPDAILALDRALRAKSANGDPDHKTQTDAAKMILRYTVGGALAPVPETADAPPLRVIFEGSAAPGWADPQSAIDGEAQEVPPPADGRSCESCGALESEGATFVAMSERCTDCDDALRAEAIALLER